MAWIAGNKDPYGGAVDQNSADTTAPTPAGLGLNFAAANQAGFISTSGAPSSGLGANGDYCFRLDGTVARQVTDGATNSNTSVTSATAAFVATDVGKYIMGAGIPVGTTISSVTNGTTIVLSQAATATATGVTLRIGDNRVYVKASNAWKPVN